MKDQIEHQPSSVDIADRMPKKTCDNRLFSSGISTVRKRNRHHVGGENNNNNSNNSNTEKNDSRSNEKDRAMNAKQNDCESAMY